jgi:hypothetical protein
MTVSWEKTFPRLMMSLLKWSEWFDVTFAFDLLFKSFEVGMAVNWICLSRGHLFFTNTPCVMDWCVVYVYTGPSNVHVARVRSKKYMPSISPIISFSILSTAIISSLYNVIQMRCPLLTAQQNSAHWRRPWGIVRRKICFCTLFPGS